MSAKGIEAGKTFIRISAEDETQKGLTQAKERLTRFAAGLYVFRTFSEWGQQAIRSVVNVAQGFADEGSKIHDLGASTGLSAEQLSALGYAAKQSGTSIDAVATAMKGMAKFTGNVASHSKAAKETLDKLGISAADFLAATPTQRLGMIADGLERIADPGLKADAAMEALGKSAMDLMPMLAGGSAELNKMLAHAQKLNLVISQADADKADELGDVWDDLRLVLGSIAFKVGRAAADALIAVFNAVTPLAVGVGRFVEQNRLLITMFLGVAAAAVVIGTVLVGLGGVFALLGIVVGGWAVALATVGAVLNAIFSPMGLLIAGAIALAAAVVYGVYAFFRYTKAGQMMLEAMSIVFNKLWTLGSKTLQGIYDALAAGNLELAANVAATGINAAFTQGWEWVKQGAITTTQFVINQFVTMAEKIQKILKAIFEGVKGLVDNKFFSKVFDFTVGAAPKVDLSGIKTAVDAATDAALTDSQNKVNAAKAALELATNIAKAERERVEAAAIEAGKKVAPPGGLLSGEGSSLSTFSAAVAGLLGRSGQSAAERTAKATEAMAEDLAAVRSRIDVGGVWVA